MLLCTPKCTAHFLKAVSCVFILDYRREKWYKFHIYFLLFPSQLCSFTQHFLESLRDFLFNKNADRIFYAVTQPYHMSSPRISLKVNNKLFGILPITWIFPYPKKFQIIFFLFFLICRRISLIWRHFYQSFFI